MKVVVQRVKEASVTNDTLNNQIKKGYCLLVGIGQNSTEQDADVIAKKIANARLFEDDNNKLNFNIQQMNGEILSVSQFTLYADVKKGNRPGFSNSKNPDQADNSDWTIIIYANIHVCSKFTCFHSKTIRS